MQQQQSARSEQATPSSPQKALEVSGSQSNFGGGAVEVLDSEHKSHPAEHAEDQRRTKIPTIAFEAHPHGAYERNRTFSPPSPHNFDLGGELVGVMSM